MHCRAAQWSCGAGLFGGRSLAQARLASLAYGPATGVYSLGPIADAKGFLKAEGLDFKLVVGNAGTHGRQSLAAGQALFAHGDASHPLQLSTRGKKAKIVLATQMIASIANIVVRKDLFDAGIDSVEKLAAYKRPNGGKPILAATAIGSGTWMYGTYTFESKGLGNTVTWVAGGGLNTMLPALETKQFDAIMAVPGWVIEAESKGFGKAIFDTSKPRRLHRRLRRHRAGARDLHARGHDRARRRRSCSPSSTASTRPCSG